VTQRGNERRDVFFTPADREVYLGILRKYAFHCGVEVLGYCLMSNHVHLVLLPHQADAMAKALRNVNMRYSQYRHALECGSGHLWQGRYYSCAVEPDRLGAVMRYVELNPVRAGMVPSAELYPWSSAQAHTGARDPWQLVAMADWSRCWTAEQWRAELRSGEEAAAAIRESTYGGRPLGSREFVGRLEQFLNRRIARGSPGRPRKEKARAVESGEI
jgi:putative transposase